MREDAEDGRCANVKKSALSINMPRAVQSDGPVTHFSYSGLQCTVVELGKKISLMTRFLASAAATAATVLLPPFLFDSSFVSFDTLFAKRTLRVLLSP